VLHLAKAAAAQRPILQQQAVCLPELLQQFAMGRAQEPQASTAAAATGMQIVLLAALAVLPETLVAPQIWEVSLGRQLAAARALWVPAAAVQLVLPPPAEA
jgi:hypothetical protein